MSELFVILPAKPFSGDTILAKMFHLGMAFLIVGPQISNLVTRDETPTVCAEGVSLVAWPLRRMWVAA